MPMQARMVATEVLSTWTYNQESKELVGELSLPMPIATRGGSIGLNPSASIAHDLLNHPDAKTLASIIVSLGLAQNLAALKALTSTGIQAGHMKLQAKSLALLAGASPEEMPQVLAELLKAKHMNQENCTSNFGETQNPIKREYEAIKYHSALSHKK